MPIFSTPSPLCLGILAIATILLSFTVNAARAASLLPAFYNPGYAGFLAPVKFMRQAPPPTDDEATKLEYAHGPITDSAFLNVAVQNSSTWTGGHSWPFIWANRARVPPGDTLLTGNPIYPPINDPSGNPYNAEFTTVTKANAVTRAQVLYVMGAGPAVWQAPLLAAGMSASDAIAWSTLNANPTDYFTNVSQDGKSKVTLDKMVIPYAVSTSAYGVLIDYEVQDHRTTSQTHDFLDQLGATIRTYGLKAYLYTNPWEDPVTQRNGFSFTRMDDIKANFDYISLYIWGSSGQCNFNTSYPYGVNFLKSTSGKLNFSQVLITFDLNLCSESTAIQLYNQQKQDHFAGYNIFPDGAVEGGSIFAGPNAVIWGLLYGN
jgi:hypothetical protein